MESAGLHLSSTFILAFAAVAVYLAQGAHVSSEFAYQVDLDNPCDTSVGAYSSGGSTSREYQKQLLENMEVVLTEAGFHAVMIRDLVATRLPGGLSELLANFYWPGVQQYHENEIPSHVHSLNESLTSIAATTAKFTVLIHHLKKHELQWAGYLTHLPERKVTYEVEITSFERRQMATALCADSLIVRSFSLTWQDAITKAQAMAYTSPPPFQYADMEAYVVLNSLVKFISYQLKFFEKALIVHF